MELTHISIFERRGTGGCFPPLAEMIDASGVCWEWLGCLESNGYGALTINSKTVTAHRAFYEILVGEIPEGYQIDHLCRNRRCVFPDHLEIVTSAENTRRGFGRASRNRLKTSCDRGHPFSKENTEAQISKGEYKGRGCITCRRQRQKLLRDKKRASGSIVEKGEPT